MGRGSIRRGPIATKKPSRRGTLEFLTVGGNDLFDVVIVGARRAGAEGLEELARGIVERFAMPAAAVRLGLAGGGLEVHRRLTQAEAVVAARSLQGLGAVVDLRPSRETSGVLTLEPDHERAGALPPPAPMFAQGGDDRDLISISRLESVDDFEVPARPVGAAAIERGAGSNPAPAPATVVGNPVARPPAVAAASPRPAAAGPRPSDRAIPAASEGAAPTLDPAAPVISAEALGGGPRSAKFAPPAAGERVELDLAAAGLTQAPLGTQSLSSERSGTRARPEPEASARARLEPVDTFEPAAARSGGYSTASGSRSATSGVHAAASTSMRGNVELAPARGMFAEDRVTSALLGAIVAVALGVVVAFAWVRRDAVETCDRLETELATAVADPIGVDDARVRAPDVIEAELADALAGLRRTFLLVWAAIALPLGIGAAALKRTG